MGSMTGGGGDGGGGIVRGEEEEKERRGGEKRRGGEEKKRAEEGLRCAAEEGNWSPARSLARDCKNTPARYSDRHHRRRRAQLSRTRITTWMARSSVTSGQGTCQLRAR